MKALYTKISNDNESLKGLWAAKLNLKGKGGSVSKEDVAKFDARYKELQSEVERRKDLGKKFDKVLLSIKQISDADEASREEHQVSATERVLRRMKGKTLSFLLLDLRVSCILLDLEDTVWF